MKSYKLPFTLLFLLLLAAAIQALASNCQRRIVPRQTLPAPG